MKPRIRKKDKGKNGSSRYILEWEEKGKVKTYALNPQKILDYIKKSEDFRRENGL